MKGKLPVLALVLLGLLGCQEKDHSPLVVITAPDSPPFTFKMDGKIAGFEIELAEAVAKELERPLKIRETTFSNIISEVASERASMSISTISITEEREKSVSFSIPYYKTGIVLISPEARPLKGPEDAASKILGVQTGTMSEKIGKEIIGAECREYDSSAEFPAAICSGKIDGALEDAPIARMLTKYEDSLAVTSPFLSDEQYGVAVPKGDTGLLKAVNKVIKKQQKDGTLQRSLDKWFRISDGIRIKENLK